MGQLKSRPADVPRNRTTETAEPGAVGTKSEDGLQRKDSSINIPDPIFRLNLNKFYPGKLTTSDAFSISRTSFQKQEPQSEKGTLEEEPQSEKGALHEDAQSRKGALDEGPQSKKGVLKEKAQSGKGALKEQAQSEKGALTEKAQSEKGALKEQAQSEKGALKEKPQSEKGALKEKPQSEKGTLKEKAQSEKGALKEQAQSEKGALKEEPQSEKGTLKEKAQSGKGALKEQAQSEKGALKEQAQSEKGTLKEGPQSEKGTLEEEPQSEKWTLEEPPQSEKGALHEDAQSRKGSLVEGPQSKAALDEEPQSKKGALKEEPQSKKGALEEEPQSKKGALEEDPQSEKEALKEKPQSEKGALKEQAQSEKEALKEQAESEKGALKEQAQSEKGALKEGPQSEKGTLEEEPQSEKGTLEEEPQSEKWTLEEQPQSEKGALDEDAQSRKGALVEGPQSKGALKEEPQSKKGALEEDPQSEKGALDEEPQSKKGALKEEPQSKKGALKEEAQSEKETLKEEPQSKKETLKEDPQSEKEALKEEPQSKKETLKEDPQSEKEALKEEPLSEKETLKEEPPSEKETRKEEPQSEKEALKEEPQSEKEALKEDPQSEKEALKEEPQSEKEALKEETQSKKETLKEEPQSEKGALKEEPQSEKGPLKKEPQSKKGPLKERPQSEKGALEEEPQSEKGPLKKEPQSKKGPLKERPQSEKGALEEEPQSEKRALEQEQQSEKGSLKVEIQSEKGPLKKEPKSEKGALKKEPQSEKGALTEKAQSGKGALTEKAQSGKGALTEKTQSGKGALTEKAQSGKGAVKEKAQSEKGALTEKAQSGKGALTEKAQSGKGAVKEKAQSGKGALTEKAQSRKGAVKEKAQSGKGALTEKAQSRKGAVKEKAQSGNGALEEEDLAFVYLNKLLTLDYRVRSITNHKVCVTSKTGKMSDNNEDLYDFLDDDNDCEDINDGNSQIHPMDVQMAVFHCADGFLKQNMVTKLSSCQYALPLLVPSPTSTDIELPLWTFRQIKKTWKSVGGLSTSLPVCQVKAPMVFFCRLGSVSTSKSQLLNSVINPKHDTFFHRDSPGSSRNRLLMEGLVEIAWYCPAGNTDDLFSNITAFYNLHGDAAEHNKPTDFVSEQATVNVVLMENTKNQNEKHREMLQKLRRSSKPLICLMSDQRGTNTMGSGNDIKYKIGLRDRNQAELHDELRSVISTCLQKCNSAPTFSLEESSELAKRCGFRVDEDSEDCQEGKTGALEITELLKGEDISQIKTKFLPCQGKLWQDWSRKNKQLYRLYGDVEQTKSRIQQEMKSIRNQQRKTSLHLMNIVCKNLNHKQIAKKKYFVRWLEIYLDVSFLEDLSEVTQQYYKQLSDVHSLKWKREITDDFRKKQEELERLSEKVDAVSCGLEHIFREMGQIYEAWAECPDKITAEVSALPALAADLLISGHPLELMDGDAAHVPLTWIESVLDKVTETLGDQRVFVLSVLGLQSSGKSTMLNTMFGLQFAVSAGRCTRGAFMQLVRVKEEAKEELKFDYLLVVDTEGLQSLQLMGKQSGPTHDNELATFVTGLADMTLINIFGENPAELKDIIQIVVQAFLRMKKVKLTPSCMFVHQNVTDISAGEKNMEGRRRLIEKLDEMTRLAAAEEVSSAEYFTDVIKFNIQTDVHYFAQLWEGNPPMAPPNPRYSENVEGLKQAVLRAAAEKKCLRLSELKVRIRDLWTAVLNEDFVFSFKNTLEITAYRRLETMYGNWTWQLRENMLFIQKKLQNQIENGKLKSVDPKLIHEEINTTFCAVNKDMEKFFNEDKDAEILSQWKVRTEQRIKDVHDSLTEETARKMTELIKMKAACKMLEDRKTQYENELFNRSKDLGSKLKGKALNEQSLRREFDSMWGKWLLDLRAETTPIKDVDVQQEVMNILRSNFESRTIYFNRESKRYTQIYNKREYSQYVTMKKGFKEFIISLFQSLDHDSIRELVQETVREAEEIIKTKPVDRTGYSDAYTQEIVNSVKKKVEEFKSERFTLNNEFTVDLSLYVCAIAVRKFTELHKIFRESNDPEIYLENKKEEYFFIFKKQCEGATAVTVFADFLCNKLKPSILQSVYDQTMIDAAGEMRTNYPAFNGNRSNLEKHILQDLAEAENFERFITYIKNPKKHFSDFIKSKFKQEMLEGTNPRILEILKNAVKMKQSSVFTAIQKTTQETEQKKGDVNEWLDRFSLELECEMKFTVSDLKGAQYQEITDTDFFSEVMNKTLQSVFNDITRSFDHISSFRMNMFRQRPQDILMKQLCGCWVQCPFCAAICTNTIEGHDGDHSVPFHRPEGVNGWKWHKTDNLVVDICTSSVASDCQIVLSDGKSVPYKTYREAGPKYACWSITPDNSEQAYWKWFVCRFQKHLENHYNKSFQGRGEIPTAWRDITKEKAIESLND